ncbi:MAG: peptidoglycan D,D-transpeptidase FtsI family protein [Verrucomicrobiales bacterium]
MPPPSRSPEVQLDSSLRTRAVGLSLGLATVFSLLGWRLVNLHVGQSDTFRQAACETFMREVVLPAPRGALYDSRGELLAADGRAYSVVVDRNLLRDINLARRTVAAELGKKVTEIPRHFTDDETCQRSVDRCLTLLGRQLGLSPGVLRREVGEEPRGEVVVMKELGDEEAQLLKDFVEAQELPGVFVRESMRRLHPFPDMAVHVLGFTNSENAGVEGLEKSLDDLLSGVPGSQWFEREPAGGESPSTTRPVQPPVAGRSVRLTLDHQIQRLLEAELDKTGDDPTEVYVPPLRARGVSVILIEPATNSIVALANRPHHTLNDLRVMTPNRAVAETFEPGSTFKIGPYVGAFDSQLVGLATPLNLHGGFYQKGNIRIADDHQIDSATVLSAFAHSSNIGAYKLASQLGAARYYGYLQALGFGQRTGVDLPGEAAGQLRPPHKWGTLSLRSLSFGYEVNVTPLQLANAFSAILNNGVLRTPRLVEAILNEKGELLEERPPIERGRVCSVQAARNLRTAMLEVVRKGTGKKAAIPGFLVGGKTGTAQRYVPARRAYAEGAYVLSFVGYVESVAGPELLGVVVIDDPEVPRSNEYGGQLAAPLFRRIAEKVLAHRGVVPNPAWMPEVARDR